MANKRLQDLSQAGSLSDTDQIYIEQGNVAFRVTLASLRSYLGVPAQAGAADHLAASGAAVGTAAADLRQRVGDHLSASGSSAASATANLRQTTVSAPVNSVAPSISGNPWEGSILTANNGTWSANPAATYTYQWKRAGTNITGATASTYQLVPADTGNAITVAVTATNSQGNATATSGAVAAILPPLIAATPAGSALYVSEGDSITAGFQASGNSYSVLFAGTDTTNITFSNQAVSGNKLADLVSRASTIDGLISSNPSKVNYVLSVLIGTNDIATGTYYPSGSAAFLSALAAYLDARRTAGYKVAICTILPRTDSAVSGAQSTFDAWVSAVNTGIRGFVTGGHADALIDFAADAVLGSNAATANTTLYADALHPGSTGQRYMERDAAAIVSSLMVAATAPTIASASITGTAQDTQTLTAVPGARTGSPAPSLSYQWKRSGTNISGATSSTYTCVTADVGATITVTITATNSAGSDSKTSSATGTVTAAPAVAPSISGATISGTPSVGSTLTAVPGTVTGSPTPTATYQWAWADTSANISGATASTYVPVSGDVGHTIKVTITETNSGGNASATSAATAAVAAAGVTFDPAVLGSNAVLSNGNRRIAPTPASTGFASSLGTVGKSSGKWYFEIVLTAAGSGACSGGVGLAMAASFNAGSYPGGSGESFSVWYGANNNLKSGTSTVAVNIDIMNTAAVGDKLMVAADFGTGKVWFGRNGTWLGSGNPAAGTAPWVTGLAAGTWFPAVGVGEGSTAAKVANFDFLSTVTYSPPSGFTTLNA